MVPLSYPEQQLFDSVVSSFNVVDQYPPDVADALVSGAEVRPEETNGVIRTCRQSIQFLHESNPEGLQEAIKAIGEPCALRIRAIVNSIGSHEVAAVS